MKKLYFIVGSQDLYGEECLKQVAEDSRQMVAFLNEKVGDLAEIELLPTVETSEICIQDMRKASNDDDCVGVITWMHTFSPAKMWIKGLQELRKPLLHLHTQANEKLPYDEIDMDFMNLNQSAHGDREYGFIVARMGIPHEVVAGYYKHDDVVAKIRQFASVAKAISYSKSLKVASFGNNMREVAVTDGDRVESQIKYGWECNYYALGDVVDIINEVTEEEIARIIERWTGIPVAKLMEGERDKLLHLEDILHERVVGQEEAVTKVSEAILRSRAGIQSANRPIGSFLFLGPTGVGKTELAKTLAECLFDDEKNMVRIDMTEYMEKFSVSRLIGAPPGYVGYEEGGQLTEAVRRHPYSVVLFDEVEKAHPDVFNILLQVLDDGRITDSQGRTVDFKNTIIILTSNLGSDIILEDLEKNRANGKNELSAEARDKIDLLLKRQFRPEFLNRLDDIIYYKSLTKDEIGGIVDLMLADLRSRLADKQLKLVVTDAAKSVIVDDGYDPIYGARPLKRYIQANVETMIAKEIIGGNHVPGDTLTVDAENGKLVLR